MHTKVTGVVLAAGSSERMGGDRPKQLLRFGDRTMVAEAVAHADASGLDEVVVVVGSSADDVAGSLETGRHRLVTSPEHLEGNVASLVVALDTIDDEHGVMVLLADMPGVAPEVINALLEAWRTADEPWAMVTEYGDGLPNHPFLLSPAARTAVADASGTKPWLALLVENPPHPVGRLQLTERPPVDVDTPEDYTEALRRRGLPA